MQCYVFVLMFIPINLLTQVLSIVGLCLSKISGGAHAFVARVVSNNNNNNNNNLYSYSRYTYRITIVHNNKV